MKLNFLEIFKQISDSDRSDLNLILILIHVSKNTRKLAFPFETPEFSVSIF